MLRTHDNWEKLVTATLRKEELWQLFHAPSISSGSSDFSCPSPPFPDFLLDFSPSNSCYQQDLIRGIGEFSSEVEPVLNPKEVHVNNKLLDSRELSFLKGCPNPPLKLRPGSYWYDKRAGFWGKLGHKPSQIINANLDVGGRLNRCASNGNTLVYINGREITKLELLLLKFADVQCDCNTNIWMYEDGSYLVHGLACTRANIWEKAGMRLLCSLLSLSFPYKSFDASGGVVGYIVDIKKLVLFGRSGSGKSTLFKQAKFLYKDIPFMVDELNNIKLLIRKNIYRYIHILLEAHQNFEEEHLNELEMYQFSNERELTGYYTDTDDGKNMYSICTRLKPFSVWLLNILKLGSLDLSSTSLIQHYAPLFEELWRDPAIQKTLERTIESKILPSVASYFLTHAVDIFGSNYIPSRMDVLYAEYCTSSTSYLDFSFSRPHDDVFYSVDQQAAFMPRYQLIRSPAKGFEDNLDGLEMFEDVGIVIFCVPLSDYDQFVVNEEGYINMMTFDKKFFESVVTHPTFDHTRILLLLTKYDLFEEKINRSPLNQCDFLAEFNPVENGTGEVVDNLAEIAFHYISVQFKRDYSAATGRKLYVSKVNGLDEESVNGVMNYAREIIQWDDGIKDKSRCCVEEEGRRKFLICI